MPAPPPLPPSAAATRSGARAAGPWLAAAAVGLLALFPVLVARPYPLHMGVVLFLAVLQAAAWNLVGGIAGQYSVGHAAYFGAGAYAAVILLERWGIAPWWGIWAAALCAVLLALVVGTVTLRLRGPYFVLASIAAAEVVRLAALHFRALTHGAQGFVVAELPVLRLPGLSVTFDGKRPFYYLTLALAVLAVAVNRTVLRSRLGYQLLAVREDQDAAHSLGIRLSLVKNQALAISAALTGMAGAVFAGYSRFIDPDAVFSLTDVSIPMVLYCLAGGAGTVEGPVVGALLLVPVSEALRNPRGLVSLGLLPAGSGVVGFVERHLSPAHQLAYGILLVLIVLFAPEGVAGLVRRLLPRSRARPRPAPPPA